MLVQECYTIKEVAAILKLTEDAVLNLVQRGDLPASNINTKADAQRPRWRITDACLGKFLLATRHQAPTVAPKRRSKAAVKDYFQ
jgi:hypothetical protein